MDLSAFYRDERKGQYSVSLQVRASIHDSITAQSVEAAVAEIKRRLEHDGLDLMPEDIWDSDIVSVRPEPTMYLVRRDGKIMGVSRPTDGDEPVAPEPGSWFAETYFLPARVEAEVVTQ